MTSLHFKLLFTAIFAVFAGSLASAGTFAPVVAEEDRAPIFYSTAPVSDPVARLQADLDQHRKQLKWDSTRGYLPAILKALAIDPSSQGLVFSKTSLQQKLISPNRPRAVYFNDDVYIGWVQNGSVMEVSAMDKQQGTIYYTLDQRPDENPKFQRQTDNCRVCHSGSMADEIPGLMVRSVFANRVGEAFLRDRSYMTDHTTPFANRWGGWYVSGTSGNQFHMGNLMVGSESAIATADLSSGSNTTDLSALLDLQPYTVPTSDIVALMTLEHQVRGHNLLTRANWETRKAIARGELNPETIKAAAEPLVLYLLFANEPRLTAPIQGTSDFAKNFTAKGPADPHGRSLRDFDLKTRMMKHPLSWLIYGEAFDALPEPAMQYVAKRLGDLLNGRVTEKSLPNLTPETREAIIQIVKSTKPRLAGMWE